MFVLVESEVTVLAVDDTVAECGRSCFENRQSAADTPTVDNSAANRHAESTPGGNRLGNDVKNVNSCSLKSVIIRMNRLNARGNQRQQFRPTWQRIH